MIKAIILSVSHFGKYPVTACFSYDGEQISDRDVLSCLAEILSRISTIENHDDGFLISITADDFISVLPTAITKWQLENGTTPFQIEIDSNIDKTIRRAEFFIAIALKDNICNTVLEMSTFNRKGTRVTEPVTILKKIKDGYERAPAFLHGT